MGAKNTDMTEFKSNLYRPNPSNHMLIALLQSSLSKGFFVAKRPFNLFPGSKLNSRNSIIKAIVRHFYELVSLCQLDSNSMF